MAPSLPEPYEHVDRTKTGLLIVAESRAPETLQGKRELLATLGITPRCGFTATESYACGDGEGLQVSDDRLETDFRLLVEHGRTVRHIAGRGTLIVYAAIFVGFVLVLPPVGYSRRHAAWWVFPYTAWIMALAVMWRVASPRRYWLDAKPSRWARRRGSVGVET